jgi:hypothetical protein
MADITMCKGEDCPMKNDCYRHRAIPSIRQSYFATPPVDKETGKCKHFWKIEKGNRINNENNI